MERQEFNSEHSLWKPASADLPRDDNALMSLAVKAGLATRAGNSETTSPIVATRLDPTVMKVFVDRFPLYDLLEKVPSNGLSHTFLQETAFSGSPTPHTIAETGNVTDDANVYLRKTTNIMLIAERRGISLKAQYAGANSGGASTDLMARELAGGLLTLARDAQNEMLTYQDADPTSTLASAPNGIYDANGINGLRYILANQAPPENSVAVDIRTPWTDQRILTAVRNVVNAITDKGGLPDLLVCSAKFSQALFADQMQLTRYVMAPTMHQITPGLSVRAISTDAGEIPVVIIPGNFIGSWGATTPIYQDAFILQTNALEIPYLGAPEPTVLRIPIGTDGSVRELAIPFVLLGLACLAPQYQGRVSAQIG
jgi:hypothetical protein